MSTNLDKIPGKTNAVIEIRGLKKKKNGKRTKSNRSGMLVDSNIIGQ